MMADSHVKVLLVEDSVSDAALIGAGLRHAVAQGQFHVITVGRLADAVERLAEDSFDVVLLDLGLPDSRGLGAVLRLRQAQPCVPIVVLTSSDNEAVGLAAIREGGQDYLLKGDASGSLIARSIRYAIERSRQEEALRKANDELEARVRQRTAELASTIDALQIEVLERTQAEAGLRQLSVQLRTLAGELTLAEQRERRRLAGVLHDHLQQLLVGAKFRAAIIASSPDAAVRQTATDIDGLLDAAIRESRSLTAELNPPILRDGGLALGLQWLGRWMRDKHALTVNLTVEPSLEVGPDDVRVLLFESVRELLFNVVKHAGVHSANVEVQRAADGQVRITVSDSGVGFDSSRLKPAGADGGGFGLFSIRERLDLIGGCVEIQSTPGKGSRFILQAPSSAPPAEASG
jgi:signal transduction histidine kinase